MDSLSLHAWGELALTPPCIWHSAGTEAARYSFSFVEVVVFFGSCQKNPNQGNSKYVFKKYTYNKYVNTTFMQVAAHYSKLSGNI